MERRRLGRSGIEVSRLSLGAMTFGSRMQPISNVGAAEATAMVERALDAGVNFLDTADAYSGGESEEILAPILARRRDELVVATKLGMGTGGASPLSGANVVAAVEASLGRLATDRIDVLYLHRPDRSTPIEETFEAIDGLVTRGLVRTAGVSNWTAAETGYASGHQRNGGVAELSSVQVYWSLVGRDVEHEVAPMCSRLDLGLVVWSPLAGGYLAGRDDGRRSAFAFPPVDATTGPRVLDVVRRVAAELGSTPAQVALAWLLRRPEVTSVILGASSMRQLDDNLGADSLDLGDEHLADLEAVSAPAPIYPQWWETAMGVE